MDGEDTRTVDQVDLKSQWGNMFDELHAALQRVVASGNFVMGEEVAAFEREWAEYCGGSYCIGVSSGTDALYLALRSLERELERRNVAKRVAMPAFTFIAAAEAAHRAGFEVELFDVDEKTAVMLPPNRDFDGVVMPVSMFGQSVPWADSRNYTIIEDASHGHGLPIRSRLMCFSFYPTKNLGAYGQAGAVVTNSEELARRMQSLRAHGEDAHVRFQSTEMSGNYRMDEIQAAFLRAKLPHLANMTTRRRRIAAIYEEELRDVGDLKLVPYDPEAVYHIYPVRTADRRRFVDFMAEKGVQLAWRYPLALHQQPALKEELGAALVVPNNAESWAASVVNLPIHDQMEYSDAEYVVECVKEFFT